MNEMNPSPSSSPPKVLNKKYSVNFSNVPAGLLHKRTASKHFQKFGTIARLILRPKRNACTVFYTSLRDVEKAKRGANLYNGIKFDIDSKVIEKKMQSRKSDEYLDPTWPVDPEVKAELEAMVDTSNEVYLRPKKTEKEREKELQVRSKLKNIERVERIDSKKTSATKKNINPVDPIQVAELLGIVNQMASTTEQRFRILEARDKLIRLHTIKQADFTKATQIVGTCPDMCPEKERLMREFQHQVAIYEQTVNPQGETVMDHSIAIKQYSRSSADQETPLPHELRPVPVLQLTMGYILHNIVDLLETSDVNVAEWYHFVWDRTRGIRKDITQQELCCIGSVELIEQCSRFHIHCAARLAGEDVSVFDQKINTENLTKCLQTLKYMYHDLELKNIHCPNEAEFRGYIILLNLHDGNFMWDVKQLRPEIQKSTEVSFAIKVYSALDNNNYVSFFKLVRSTSYLNACILLRYFNLIRYRAINRIIRTHSSRAILAQLPLSELQKILAFEDLNSTINFLEYHGLSLNELQTHVILDRNNFFSPATSYGADRAVNIIESKRTISVGEVICGKALPPKHFEYHIPHSSFDSKGYLKKSEIDEKWSTEMKNVKDEKNTKTFEVKSSNTFSQPKILVEQKIRNIDATDSKDTHFSQTLPTKEKESNIFGTVSETKSNIFSPTTPFIFKPQQTPLKMAGFMLFKPFEKPSSNLFPTSTNSNFSFKPSTTPMFQFNKTPVTTISGFKFALPKTTKPVQKIFTPQIQEQKVESDIEKLEKAKLEAQRIEIEKLKALEEERKRIIEEKRIQEEKRALEEKQRQLEEKGKREIEEEKERQRKLELEQRRINEEIAKQKAEEEALRAEAELRAKLLEQRRLILLAKEKRERDVKDLLENLLEKVEIIETNRKLKEISVKILNWKMILFYKKWRNKVEVSIKKKKMIDNVPIWMSRRSFHEEAEELFTPNQMEALNNMRRYKTGFLKRVIPLQDSGQVNVDILGNIYRIYKRSTENLERKIVNTLNWKVIFSLPDETECDYYALKLNNILLYAFRLTEDSDYLILNKFRPNTLDTFNVCFQKIKGVCTIPKNEKCDLFFVGMNDDISIKILKNRLQRSFFNATNRSAKPVIFLFRNGFHSLSENEIVEQLSLKSYKANRVILDYHILIDNIGSDKKFLNLIDQGLCWLAEKVQPKPPLEMNLLAEMVREALGAEFIYRIHMSAKSNEPFRLLLADVNSVITIYNNGVHRLMKLASSKHDWEYYDFPEELKQFNSKSSYPCDFTHFPHDWKTESFQKKLNQHFNTLLLPKFSKSWPPKDEHDLKETLFDYCEKIEKGNTNLIFLNVLSFVLDNIRDFNDLQYFPWVHILQIVLNHKINKIDQNEIVIYNRPNFKYFKSLPWWFQIKSEQEKIYHLSQNFETEDLTPNPKRIKLLNSTLDFDLDTKIKELSEANIVADSTRKKTQQKIDDLKALLDDLESSIHIQKINARKFEDIINREINFNK